MKPKYEVEQYKEAVLYEVQNGKRIEIRRFKFKLTETESMLLRRAKKAERKLLRVSTALKGLSGILESHGSRLSDVVTDKDIDFAEKVLKELK